MNTITLSLTPFISSKNPFKGFVVEREKEVLKERMKTNREKGGERLSLSLCSLCEKDCLIFQTAKRVPSNKLHGSC